MKNLKKALIGVIIWVLLSAVLFFLHAFYVGSIHSWPQDVRLMFCYTSFAILILCIVFTFISIITYEN